MITLLQAQELADSTASLVKDVANGHGAEKVDKLVQEGIQWGVEAGKAVLLAVAIFVVGRFVINIINKVLARLLDRRQIDPSIKSFVKSFVNILLTLLLIITVVSALGVDTTSFAALLASCGVAVGLALSGNLQNLAGGLIILLFKPFKVGDFIEAQGATGTVKEIQIFHTIITTVDNKEVFIPNGALSSGSVTNYSQNAFRRVDITVGVDYGEDIDKVRRVLDGLIAADERIEKDPKHDILLSSLSASSVDIQLRLWVKAENYWGVYFGMNEAIYNEFNRQGINFPFPQLTVHSGK